MAFDNLNISVSARTADAVAGLGAVAGAADEAADEIDDAGDEAGRTSRAFTTLSASAGGLSVGLASVNSIMTGGLLVSLGTLLTTLAPLAATLGVAAAAASGLALGFGAVLGIPLATHFEEVSTAFGIAAEQIEVLLQPLGEQFLPLLLDAAEALPELVDESLAALGPLDEFADTLRGFGELAMDAIPALVGGLAELGREALPGLRRLVDFLLEEGPGAFDALQESAREIGPELDEFLAAVVDLAPTLLEFGTNVADVVLPPLTDFVRLLDDALEFLNGLDPAFRDAAIAGLVLAPVLAKLAGTLSTIAGLSLGGSILGSLGGAAGGGGILGGLAGLAGGGGAALAGLGGAAAGLGALGIAGGSRTLANQLEEQGIDTSSQDSLLLDIGRFAEQNDPLQVKNPVIKRNPGSPYSGNTFGGMRIENVTINANDRRGGREAARAFERYMNGGGGTSVNIFDTSRGGP